jgi:hypothetical protein
MLSRSSHPGSKSFDNGSHLCVDNGSHLCVVYFLSRGAFAEDTHARPQTASMWQLLWEETRCTKCKVLPTRYRDQTLSALRCMTRHLLSLSRHKLVNYCCSCRSVSAYSPLLRVIRYRLSGQELSELPPACDRLANEAASRPREAIH